MKPGTGWRYDISTAGPPELHLQREAALRLHLESETPTQMLERAANQMDELAETLRQIALELAKELKGDSHGR